MKKIVCFFMVACIMLSCIFTGTSANSNILMIYDGETIRGVQEAVGGHGMIQDLDYDNFTQGESALIMYSLTDRYQFFFSYMKANDGATFNMSGYDYYEMDIMSHATVESTLRFSFVADDVHVSGYDWRPDEAFFFPKNTWIHVKIPISALSAQYDPVESAPTLTEVCRVFMWLYDPTDMNGDVYEGLTLTIDNMCLTKGGEGSANTLLTRDDPYWEDWEEPDEETSEDTSSETPPEESSEVISEVSSEIISDVSSDSNIDVAYGDINTDGDITSADALDCLQFAVNKKDLTETQVIAANVDGVGDVTSSDALLILQYAVKKISEFPVSK